MFIVEDGSRVPNANSYVTVEYADAYHELFDNSDWLDPGITDEQKEKALIRACSIIEMFYGARYMSLVLYREGQALLFPRQAFYDADYRLQQVNTIPKALKDAQCEVALKVLAEDLLHPDTTDDEVESESITVGPVSIDTTYKGREEEIVGFDKVDRILRPILKPVKNTTFAFTL